MSAVNVIIDKELKVAFNSLATYIIYTVFFCITGFICWFSWKNVFYSGQASLNYLFNVFYWTLFLMIPVLTMKSISDERKDGTFELLFTETDQTVAIPLWQILRDTPANHILPGVDTALLYHADFSRTRGSRCWILWLTWD